MEAKIIHKNKEVLLIEWDNGGQFGQLTMVYNKKGGFILDAEYVSIDTVIEVFKSLELTKKQK